MLPTLNPHAGGIDAGSTQFFLAVPDGAVTSCENHTAGLERLRDHLQAHGVTTVAMEAAGVYWLCLFGILEAAGIDVCLVNGAHVKNLPGRKSDVQDCQWLQELPVHGLLCKSFVPPENIRALRSYTRLRDGHIRTAARQVQLMHKALDQLYVNLPTVISQIHGLSGLAVVCAILQGERNPAKLAELCDPQILKKKRAEVERSLHGRWKKEHLLALKQALAGWEFREEQVRECDTAIAGQPAELTAKRTLPDGPLPPAAKQGPHHVPAVPKLHAPLLALSGGQGCGEPARLPDTGCSSSSPRWARICRVGPTRRRSARGWRTPPANVSPARKRRARARPKTSAGPIFRLAAQRVGKSSYLALGGFYRRLKARTKAAVATVATARKLAVLFYHAMQHGLAYVERGLEAYEQAYRERQRRYLQKRAAELGLSLVPLHDQTAWVEQAGVGCGVNRSQLLPTLPNVHLQRREGSTSSDATPAPLDPSLRFRLRQGSDGPAG